MWPILIVSIIAVAVVLERVFWWTGRWMRRDPKRIEKVFTAIETGDVAEASRLSRGSGARAVSSSVRAVCYCLEILIWFACSPANGCAREVCPNCI